MSPPLVARIDTELQKITHDAGVAIPLAIESGSRAWGFPSPDSDYDCRFIFVRTLPDYLSLWPQRDVIEYPPDGDIDISGWDLGKAIRLLLKGNAVVIEWLTSPIVYGGDAEFRDAFLALARVASDRQRIAQHYLHLGQRQRRTYFGDGEAVPRKKIFYALRPAMVLRWLRLHPDQTVAPMHFPTLVDAAELPRDIVDIVTPLIDQKAQGRELGSAPIPGPVATLIDEEFALAADAFGQTARPVSASIRERADVFFRATVERFASGTASIR